jgi:hypothetical protein
LRAIDRRRRDVVSRKHCSMMNGSFGVQPLVFRRAVHYYR